MGKLIAMLIGAWVMYCQQVGDYAGAMFILLVYGIIMLTNYFYKEKDVTSSSDHAKN